MPAASAVGARELKTRLGRYLNRVRRGHSFIVTDRHEPIAELRPLGGPADPVATRLAAQAALGHVTLPSKARLTRLAPVASTGPLASEVIRNDRADRF